MLTIFPCLFAAILARRSRSRDGTPFQMSSLVVCEVLVWTDVTNEWRRGNRTELGFVDLNED